MEPKPAALLLAPEAPYPLAGGGALRCAGLMHYLAARYELDVAVFREPGAPDPTGDLPEGLVRRLLVIDLPWHSKARLARVFRNLTRLARGVPPLNDRFGGFDGKLSSLLHGRRYELAVIEHFWCAGYGEQLGMHAGRVVLDLHNVESVLHARCATGEAWPVAAVHRRFQTVCRRLEQRWLPEFWLVLAASEDDAETVRRIAPGCRVLAYPNTIPSQPAPIKKERDLIAFSGNLEYHPNVAAVRFFRRKIWPLLRERRPELEWVLIGRNAHGVARELAGDARIHLIGPVENAVEVLAQAKAAVVPLLAGSGTRVKILEAWAAGVPVVSTSVGAEGLPVVNGKHLLIADEPGDFAGAVSNLLDSGELRRRLGESGRSLYEREFTWEAGWVRLAGSGI